MAFRLKNEPRGYEPPPSPRAPTSTAQPTPQPTTPKTTSLSPPNAFGDSYQPPTKTIPKGLEDYRTSTTMVFMDCKPHQLRAGQAATCTARVPPTTTVNIPNRVDGKLYDVTYNSGQPTAKVPKNLPVEVLSTRQLADGTYEVKIRALKDAWVGPITMGSGQIAGPIFLETRGRYASSRQVPDQQR